MIQHENIKAVDQVVTRDYAIYQGDACELIRAIPGGAITDAQALKVDYTKAAIADGWAINGSTKASIRVYVLLDGENIATGELIQGEFWDVVLTPDQEIDFLSDNLVEIGLNGSMQKPSAKPSAYVVRGRGA